MCLGAEAKIAKIDVAKEVLSGIIDLLHPDDRFSIILFTGDTCQPKPLGLVRCTNITGLQQDLWVSRGRTACAWA